MTINPTPTQAEIDAARIGNNSFTHAADGSAADPNTPPWNQTLPVNTTPPAISGTPALGQVLTVSNGVWSGDVDSYSYQWIRGAATNIPGATNRTYTVVAADQTNTLKCRVSATNSKGAANATSAATAAVP